MAVKKSVSCKTCGADVELFRNPLPTVDIIIEMPEGGIVFIHRKNEPRKWALPGGYVDYGETLEAAAAREAKEETSIEVSGLRQFHAYSDPARDERSHNISVVFTAKGEGEFKAADDADDIGIFGRDSLPSDLAFDHAKIVDDYFSGRY